MTDTQPHSLIKFLDEDAALDVFERQRLRWVAPAAFDDPFALDETSDVAFDAPALAVAAGRTIATAVFSRQAPSGLPGHAVTNVIRRWRAQRRFNSEDEVMRALRTVLPALVERQMESVAQVVEDWRAFASRVRVLCLHERHGELALWHRLADRHRGVALRLQCDEGGTFANPCAVQYQPRRPHITSLQEQVEVLVGQARHVPQNQFRGRLLARARTESADAEWRCFRHLKADDAPATAEPFEDVGFATEELRAVYLGARLPAASRERILALLAERYPRTRVFQAAPHEREFGLEFTPLGDAEPDAEPAPAAEPEAATA